MRCGRRLTLGVTQIPVMISAVILIPVMTLTLTLTSMMISVMA